MSALEALAAAEKRLLVALETIESLRSQLAEKDARIARLEGALELTHEERISYEWVLRPDFSSVSERYVRRYAKSLAGIVTRIANVLEG